VSGTVLRRRNARSEQNSRETAHPIGEPKIHPRVGRNRVVHRFGIITQENAVGAWIKSLQPSDATQRPALRHKRCHMVALDPNVAPGGGRSENGAQDSDWIVWWFEPVDSHISPFFPTWDSAKNSDRRTTIGHK